MDPRVTELHCIMPMGNLPSVMQHGILSHERAAKLAHHSVALQRVQDKRSKTLVPQGLRLHQYANLYFDARNPMMSLRRAEAPNLCVLKVLLDVLKTEGVVITDQNAASGYARFMAPSQWREMPFDDVFARFWTHAGDQIREWRHKSRKCAEVLVPHQVEPKFIQAAYVVDLAAQQRLDALGCGLRGIVNPDLFFR